MIMVAKQNERQDAYRRLGRVEEAMDVGALHPPVVKEQTNANDLTLDALNKMAERQSAKIAKYRSSYKR